MEYQARHIKKGYHLRSWVKYAIGYAIFSIIMISFILFINWYWTLIQIN